MKNETEVYDLPCLVKNSAALHPVPKKLLLKVILGDMDFKNLSQTV